MGSKGRDLVHIKNILPTIFVFLALLLTCCSPTPDANWELTTDPVELMILDTDVPSGWEPWGVTREPFPQGEYLGVVFKKPQPDLFQTNGVITQNITIFDQIEDAKSALEADYQDHLKLTIEIAEANGLPQEDFDPPSKHTYRSPLADEFRVIYSPERTVAGPIVGYSYTVWARYGNVLSWFVTIVADEDETGIGPEEANILPWNEVERLLMLIDERFEKVGKSK